MTMVRYQPEAKRRWGNTVAYRTRISQTNAVMFETIREKIKKGRVWENVHPANETVTALVTTALISGY